MVNLRKIDISLPVVRGWQITREFRLFPIGRVYSARRLRHRDNLPPPAKARPSGSARANVGARLSINQMVAG